MHELNRDKRDSLVYDPQIKGYDNTFFSNVAGTPSTSAGKLTFNAATAASYLLFELVELANFAVTVPAAPTSGDSRRFGFFSPAASSNMGALYFDITGTVFTVKCVDNAGNVQTQTIAWQAGWTNTQIIFGIAWEPDRVQFWVNGAIVATFATISGSPGASIPNLALPLYIKNGNSDTMTVAYLDLRSIAGMV